MCRVLLAAWTVLPALCQNSQTCPWLNSATAAGVLDGPVTSTVVYANRNKDDSSCVFVRQNGPRGDALRIEVRSMINRSVEFSALAAKCASNATPLVSIGNEAVACSKGGRGGERSEEVVGRVRERAFMIRVSTHDPSRAKAELREKARNVAEQVAGILF